MEKRSLKIIFSKSGSGSRNSKISIPISWIDAMELTPDDRDITVIFDGKKIIIEKK